MQRALCESCNKPQPRDWEAGHLCSHCGGTVRRDVRCAWCASFSPWPPASPSAFCRECGCQMVPPERYGAARMMKDAGVDRLTLAKRLGELDPGQLETFASIYARQAAVVATRVDECRFVESFLLQSSFSSGLEDELTASIPSAREKLAELGGGPQPPFENPADAASLLRAIAAGSPVRLTRTLAHIARVARGDVDEASWTATLASTSYGYGPIAVEGALALARPSARAVSAEWARGDVWVLPHLPLEVLGKIAEIARLAIADPRLATWAAVAVALAIDLPSRIPWHAGHAAVLAEREILRDALAIGLDAGDPELRFAAALALRDATRLEPELRSGDVRRRSLAETALAQPGGTHAPVVLADMSSHAWDGETNVAAACALAAIGAADRRVMERLLSATFHEGDASPAQQTAALAFGSWRVRAAGAPWIDGRAMQRLEKIVGPLLRDPARGPYAAVLLAMPLTERLSRRDGSGHDEAKRRLEELAPALRDGLSSRDADLAFACALALREEAALAAAIDSPDADRARLAREAVASTQSTLSHRVFRTGTDDARREALRALHHPVDEPTMRAVMDGILASAPPPDGPAHERRDTFRERGLDFLHSGIRFEQHPPAIRALIGAFFRDHATTLRPERLLEVLDWACQATDTSGSAHRPREDAEVKPFVEAATRALDAVPPGQRAGAVESRHGWFAWIHNADDAVAKILAQWVVDPALTEPLFERIHFNHGQLSWDAPPDLRAQALLVRLWNDLGSDAQLAIAPVLAGILRGAAQHRDGYFACFWDRFKSIPGERDALLVLLASYRRELEESSGKDGVPLRGADPAKSFRLQYATDTSSVYELTKRAVADLTTGEAPGVIAACCEAADDYVLENVLTALACFEVLSEWVCQRVLDEKGSDAAAALNAQVDVGYRATRKKAIDGLPANKTKEHYFESKCERIDAALAKGQLEVELMTREAARRIAEAEEKKRQLDEAERTKRERELAIERARRDAEAERMAEERLRPVATPVTRSGAPLDSEVLLPEQPLRTLADYVDFMRALSGGANAVELMNRHGMDVQKYSACAIAWGQLMTTRSDVAVRFGQLMQAPR